MKKFMIFGLLLFGFSAAYSQDLIKEVKLLTLANDSLQRELNLARENSNKELQTAKDSIKRLHTSNDRLEKDKTNLNEQVKKLDKKNIKSLETKLQQKTDSINILKDSIRKKEEQITSIKNESKIKEPEKYKEGQQNVYGQIGQQYQTGSLDDLIKYSTQQSVQRDLQLIGNNEDAGKKLKELQIYFASQQLLGERYDEEKVKNAQVQLNNINQSVLVKNLNDKLGKYKLCNDGLKTTIGKIIELDKKFTANNDETQGTKLQDVLSQLSWYFYNYRFNFTDYPFLSGIILEIMKLKQKNANATINDFSSKL